MAVKVLFDFDLFGDLAIDTHLLDIMLAIKAEFDILLAPYEKEIEADRGLILVTIRPEKLTFKYHYSADTDTCVGVQSILKTFAWQGVVKRYTQLAQN